jgi:hypothetical protein
VERLGDGSFSTTRKKRPVPHPGTGNMSTTEAEKKRDEFMRTSNGSQEPDSDGTRPLKLREFIEQQYLLLCRKKWKASTAGTSEDRIRPHIIADIADRTMREFISHPSSPFWTVRRTLAFPSRLSTIYDGTSGRFSRWRLRRR